MLSTLISKKLAGRVNNGKNIVSLYCTNWDQRIYIIVFPLLLMRASAVLGPSYLLKRPVEHGRFGPPIESLKITFRPITCLKPRWGFCVLPL